MTIKAIATITGTPITFWQIGENIYRVTNPTLDTAGMPMGKRWEAPLATWLHYQKAGAFPHVTML